MESTLIESIYSHQMEVVTLSTREFYSVAGEHPDPSKNTYANAFSEMLSSQMWTEEASLRLQVKQYVILPQT